MKKIKTTDLEGFVKDVHHPYTDYNEEIADWLMENAEVDNQTPLDYGGYIFTDEQGTFYGQKIIYSMDVYYTNEEFKEWIGMNKIVETVQSTTMPKLVAGRHYVRFSNGRFAQVMDGYINYVSIGEDAWDIRITGWDLVGDSVAGAIVEVFDNVFSNSNQYTHLDYFNSGKITIWKKEDERKQRIQQELEFAKAKAERLASHIAVLESKLK